MLARLLRGLLQNFDNSGKVEAFIAAFLQSVPRTKQGFFVFQELGNTSKYFRVSLSRYLARRAASKHRPALPLWGEGLWGSMFETGSYCQEVAACK